MNNFDENQAVRYNQDKSCKISDINIGFIESLKRWIRKRLLTKKDKKAIESGLKDNLRYSTNISRAEREELLVKDKLSSYSGLVTNLYSEITGALSYNSTGDKIKSKELCIELRDFIIEYLYTPAYKLLKRKAEDFYEDSIDSYNTESEINITASNISGDIDDSDYNRDYDNWNSRDTQDEGFLIEGLHIINSDKNYNDLHAIVYSEDYNIAGISSEYDTQENRLRFSSKTKNIKDIERRLLVDIERESDTYLDVKAIHINIREVKDKLDKVNYKRCNSKGRTELNNKRAKFNRENNLRGKRNYIISYNNSKLKFFNKVTVLETMINKFFNNILISKIIIDTEDSLNNYVNLFSKFSYNYYALGDFNYLYSYEITEYRKQVNEDIRNNTGIYDRSSLELNNYMPRHIMDIYTNHMNNISRFNGELVIVDRDKENIEEDIKYMDSLIVYYSKDKDIEEEKDKNKEENKNKKRKKKRQARLECSSFQDYLDKTVGKLINARIKSVVDKYNSDEDKNKYSFMSSIQKLKYKYVDKDYSAPLTDIFLLYFDRDTVGMLNNNCLEKVFKMEGNHKQKVLFEALKTIYEQDSHVKNFKRSIDNQYIDDNNNIVNGLQNKNLVIQLHKELYYRVFNLSYLSQAIEDRVKKIISRYYYIEYMNKWKKISDQVKDKEHYLYKYKGKLIKRNYNVCANLNMLLNIEDLFRDEYIDYLDKHNKFTLHDNFMRAKDAEPWYEESDRFMDIPYNEKLTLFEEYTLIDNEYIIEHVAKPIVVKFNELVNKIVSAKNKKSVLSNIQKLVRLNINLEGITNITNDYINQEYDYKTELSEAYDDYKRNIVDYIDDNIIMSRKSNIFREYFDLTEFALYNNSVPYNLTHFTNNEGAFSFKNVIDRPGDTDCKDHFWLTDYEKVFGKRIIKENHPGNLNWPEYNNVTELSGHMIGYIEEIAESRVLYKIKIEDINKL